MKTLRQAAQAVIEQWDGPDWNLEDIARIDDVYSALRAALAAPEQEPVATVTAHRGAVAVSGMGKFPAVGTNLYAAPVEPYDQQALELCGECGWKAIMPGTPCFVCNMQVEAQQVAVPAPDMFWNHDDADKLYSSISEFLNDEMCNGTPLKVGDIRTVQRAVRLPNIYIRITSIDDEECDADYEIVEAKP